MVKFYLTKSPSQTKKLGEILAKEILKRKSQKAVVIGLAGELGSGKTTFLQGFAKGLRIKGKILSPSFVIIKRFKVKDIRLRPTHHPPSQRLGPCKFRNFYHIDCYRIEKPKEILDLGFKEIIFYPKNIVAIEWAEKIKKFLPKNALVLKFEFIGRNKRKISLKKELSPF